MSIMHMDKLHINIRQICAIMLKMVLKDQKHAIRSLLLLTGYNMNKYYVDKSTGVTV